MNIRTYYEEKYVHIYVRYFHKLQVYAHISLFTYFLNDLEPIFFFEIISRRVINAIHI